MQKSDNNIIIIVAIIRLVYPCIPAYNFTDNSLHTAAT